MRANEFITEEPLNEKGFMSALGKAAGSFAKGAGLISDKDYERISKYLHCVITLQTLLKHYKIDFLFFNAIQDLHGLSNFDLTIFDHLLNEIDRDRYFLLENGTFNTWDEEKKYLRGPNFHPLEKGHTEWAKVLYDHINKNGLYND